MKKLLLSLLLAAPVLLSAQDCSELFISGYAEGYANNRAIELYNPTSETINLSGYSLARYSNGSTSVTAEVEGGQPPYYVVELPDAEIAPYDVFVIVVDKQEVSEATITSQFDKPVWNGYLQVGEIIDEVTNEPLVDENGNVITGVQYDDDGNAQFDLTETTYYDYLDLQGKADAFLCPSYAINRVMYFNGNDAVVLLKGNQVVDGTEIIDVIGVIGEDPDDSGSSIVEGWVDEEGSFLTTDRTIKRTADVKAGTGVVLFTQGGTLDANQWESYGKNTFSVLGSHTCDCDETSGVAKLDDLNIGLYPNPADDFLTVEAETTIKTISVTNMAGSLVSVQTTINNNKANLNLLEMPEGVYLIQVELVNGEIGIQRLMVK